MSLWSFVLIVVIPTLLGGIYYGFMASDRYVVEVEMAVRDMQGPQVGMLGALLGGAMGNSGPQEPVIIEKYVTSAAILKGLQEWLGLRESFSQPEIDIVARLSPDASNEKFLRYYRDNIVEVVRDVSSGTVTLRVRAYTADDAYSIAKAILVLADTHIDQLSKRAREDAVRFAREEVRALEERRLDVEERLAKFRNTEGEIDLSATVAGRVQLVAELEAERAKAQAELSQLSSYMRANSPQVMLRRQRVKSFQRQIAQERENLASSKAGAISGKLTGYERLLVQRELVMTAYNGAVQALEMGKAAAQQKQLYLVPFVPPVLPSEAIEPERLYQVATILLVSLVVYVVAGLGIGTLREHLRA